MLYINIIKQLICIARLLWDVARYWCYSFKTCFAGMPRTYFFLL